LLGGIEDITKYLRVIGFLEEIAIRYFRKRNNIAIRYVDYHVRLETDSTSLLRQRSN